VHNIKHGISLPVASRLSPTRCESADAQIQWAQGARKDDVDLWYLVFVLIALVLLPEQNLALESALLETYRITSRGNACKLMPESNINEEQAKNYKERSRD